MLAAACGSDSSPAEPDAGVDLCAESKFAPVSAPCCLDNGVDACGGGLFCAALDGRSQAVCYPEYSRPDRSECTEDRQCLSQSCNLDEAACRSVPATVCDQAIGCAPAADLRFVCDVDESLCESVGDGEPGALCELDSDCAADSPACDAVTHRCERWPTVGELIDEFPSDEIRMVLGADERLVVTIVDDGYIEVHSLVNGVWDDFPITSYETGSLAIPGQGDTIHIAYLNREDDSGTYTIRMQNAPSINDPGLSLALTDEVEVGLDYAMSMVLDENRAVRLIYRSGERLFHARGVSNNEDFVIEQVITGLGDGRYRTSAAMNGDDLVVAYDDGDGAVELAVRSGESGLWSFETVADGHTPSLAIDSQGAPHLTFFDPDTGAIRYATKSIDEWVIEDVVKSGAASRSSLVIDEDDTAHVLYHLDESQEIKYAYRVDFDWITARVDIGGPAGTASALAIGSDGTVHVAFSHLSATFEEGGTRYATLGRP